MKRGFFFSLDGIDGAGKSSQMKMLCGWLQQQGHDVVTCRDPGSTPLGEAIRKILLDRHDIEIHRRSEMLLYMAARAQLVEEFLLPSLKRGQTVISDRFLLANVAYQAHGGGLDVPSTWRVGEVATAGLEPDLTLLLDLDVATAGERIQRARDRMESQGEEFLERVRQGFLKEAAARPTQVVVISAAGDSASVQEQIRQAVGAYLTRHSGDWRQASG